MIKHIESETAIYGARADWIAEFLIANGATLLRVEDNPRKYIFIDDNSFLNAFALFQVELRRGFFDFRKEV